MTSIPLATIRSADSQWLFYFLLCLLLFVFAFPFTIMFILLPLKQWRKPMITVDPDHVPTDADHFTPEMLDFLSPLLPQFLAMGFEVVSNLKNQKSVANVSSVRLLLVNRHTQESATIVLTQAQLIRNQAYSFMTRFADETEIQTSVNRNVGFTPKNPQIDSLAVPFVPDVAALLEFHRRRVQHLGRQNDPRIVTPPGQELSRIIEIWHRQAVRWESLGYCYLDSTAQVYRKTLKVAFLSTWKMIPHIRRWRTRRRDRRSLRIWQQLGMNDWLDTHTPASAITPPTHITAPRSPLDDELHYEIELPPGEIRQQITPDGSVIIRMGRQSTKSYLLSNWLSLGFIILFVFIIIQFLFSIWIWRHVPSSVAYPFVSPLIQWIVLLSILTVWQIYTYLRGLTFTGGTAVLTATPAGLRFHNVPFRPRKGFIPRQDLRGLYIIKTFSGFRRIYRLMATHHTGRQFLLTSRHRPELQQLSSTLATSLGITLPPQPTSEPASSLP